DMSGEAASRANIDLPGVQPQLLEAIHATGTPIVLVVMSGRPLTIPWAAEHVPAIVESWFLGVEDGSALAAVLFGDVSPSGKLPVTFPRAVGQIPLYYNHKNTGRPTGPDKYTSKYTDLPVTPLFPFGHGLSYTTFSYSDLRLSAPRITPAGTLRASVPVTTRGCRLARVRCFPDRHPRIFAPVSRYRWWSTPAALFLLGCGGPFPQSTLHPHSDFARATDVLFTGIFWWAAAVFVVVEALLLVALVRFRHREGRPAPKPTHGHTLMEIAWTLAPAAILVFVAVPTVRTIFATAGEAPADALKVDVIGHQWWWEFRYQELGLVTANELHVPLGRAVQLSITSADVIHSFWIPPLGGKRDAIPGHVTRIAFRPDQVGEYAGQCAEFCGASHANMRLRVVVESDSGFGRWATVQLEGPAAPAPGTAAERGKA